MGQLAFAVIAAVASAALADVAQAGATLDAIKARQHVICGVDTALRGFSVSDAEGEWSGFDVDICRAVAAAVLGDPGKVRFEPTRTIVRFDFLRSGKIDVLSRNTTWTMSRETELPRSRWRGPCAKATANARDVVKWTIFALMEAEEYGVTSRTWRRWRSSRATPRRAGCSALHRP